MSEKKHTDKKNIEKKNEKNESKSTSSHKNTHKSGKTELDAEVSLREAFREFDKDGKGTVTASELRQVMAESGQSMTETEINDLMKQVDKNSDGKINYEEFVKMMTI